MQAASIRWMALAGAAAAVAAAAPVAVRSAAADEWRAVSDWEPGATMPQWESVAPAPGPTQGLHGEVAPPLPPIERSPVADAHDPFDAGRRPQTGASEALAAERRSNSIPPLPTLAIPPGAAMKDRRADLPAAGTIARMATMTGLVIVIGAAALAALRHSQGRVRRPAESGLQLHGTISLGARNGLHLVSVKERTFLVAVDARGVSCIAPIAGEFAEIVDAGLEHDRVVDELEEGPISSGARPAGRA